MRRRILTDIDMINVVRDINHLKSIKENKTIQDLQNLLISKKINVGQFGADGSAGNDTLKAINQALAGVSATPSKTETTITSTVGSPTDIESGVNVSTINMPTITPEKIVTAPTTSGYQLQTKVNTDTNKQVNTDTNKQVNTDANKQVNTDASKVGTDYRTIDIG